MLNELTNYCQPDLNTVLFGIPESDFHTNYSIIVYLENINLILAFIINIISQPIELLNISSAFIV